MGTTAEKLAYLKQTKQQLKTAINNKGGSLTDDSTFRDYVDVVNDIIAEQHTDYDGPYTITENGTLPTAGKAMTDNLVVDVSSSGDHLSNAWEAYKKKNKTDWTYAFGQQINNAVLSCIENLDFLDFSGAENVRKTDYMFQNCGSLTSVPAFNTSNVTQMSGMFNGCGSLTSVPAFNTSNVTNMNYMFNGCGSLTSVPAFNTSNVTNMNYMLSSCNSLTSVPAFDTSNVTQMSGMFYNCNSLTSVPAFNTSNVTNMNNIFYECRLLEEVHMFGMKVNFDISASTKFTREALLEIINNCQDLTGQTSHRIQMGSTNLAKLTDEDKLIATNKNWTLA